MTYNIYNTGALDDLMDPSQLESGWRKLHVKQTTTEL